MLMITLSLHGQAVKGNQAGTHNPGSGREGRASPQAQVGGREGAVQRAWKGQDVFGPAEMFLARGGCSINLCCINE